MVTLIVFYNVCTLNKIGSLEGTLQYYYHATPREPLQVKVSCLLG